MAFRRLTIIAQDPSVRSKRGILRARVEIPDEPLAPGPLGYRAQVVDYDASTNTLYRSLRLGHTDPFATASDRKLLSDPQFHQQNVYAIVMRTLARFEFALGRRVGWSFRGHQLKIAPHAFAGANAYYSKRDRAMLFGYFTGASGDKVFTCLSHDVVAHETTHALLDGLRERYRDPSSPDQAAFHEGFADVVALLSVFSLKNVVGALLPTGRRKPTVAALRKSALLGLAQQFGSEVSGVRNGVLRRSAALKPSRDSLKQPEFAEPHRRGELLVAAMMNAFLHVWVSRLEGRSGRERIVEEGACAADHLLTMSIRAIDYCPPTDIEFRDFLSALLTADTQLRPGDGKYHYRRILLKSFQDYGIRPTSKGPQGVWETPEGKLSYAAVHFESIRHDPDEVFRFIWANRRSLGLCGDAYTRVLSVRPCQRVGADGFVLRETVAEYIQRIDLPAGELKRLGIGAPSGLPSNQEVTLFGGGALIFDEYGRLKFHVRNKILNSARQTRRLRYLWRKNAA
jgi:hypothetical protein